MIKDFKDWLEFKSERFPALLLLIGYLILIGGCLVSFSSCMNEKKAAGYFDKHKVEASKYCSETFPVKPETIVEFVAVDSSGYNEAYNDLLRYADSLLNEKKDTVIIEGKTVVLYDTVRLRERIEVKLRSALKPCIDSIKTITKIVPDEAKIYYLTSQIQDRDKKIEKLEGQLDNRTKQRNWLFIILLILLLYTFRKPLLTLIKFV